MTYQTFSGAWLSEIRQVEAMGARVFPRGLETTELRFRQIVVEDPTSFPVAVEGRKFADVIGVLEGLSLVGQVSIPELFTDRIAKFGEFMDHGVFHGAYGTRVHGRLGDLVELLARDFDTRQAVLSIFDSRSDLGPSKRDIPCTLSLQFFGRRSPYASDRGMLELGVTMRSNDMWLGTPYDFAQFATLQLSVAQALGVDPGRYTHTAGSLHVYDRDVPKMHALTRVQESGVGFPLWGDIDGATPGERWAQISSRARRLLLDPTNFDHRTEFEAYAVGKLWR